MCTNAVIDLGSNSIRIMIYKITKDKSFIILDEDKVNARLGNHLDKNNVMDDDGIQIVINTLIGFKSLCFNYKVENIDIVATEAIRKAQNSNEICSKVKASTGFNIRILSGLEEARYGYISVKHSFNIDNALIFDIGGSSMELTLMENKESKNSLSIPLGALPLTQMFNNITTDNDRANLKDYITTMLDSIEWIPKGSHIHVIGIGGTARALGKVHKKMTSYPSDLLHNYKIKSSQVKGIYDSFKYIKISDRNKVKGLSSTRADIFLAPLGAIDSILSYCDSSFLTISEGGIRDGIIYERTLENYDVSNISYSIINIINRNNIDKINASLISDLSTRIYGKLGEDSYEVKLLIISSLLSNIGLNVSSRRKDNHSFYMLSNTNIAELTLKENIMISYIVARMWKRNFKMDTRFEDLLSKDDLVMCKKISSILYISHLLVRYLNNDSRLITISCNDDVLQLTIPRNFAGFLNTYISTDRLDDIDKYFGIKLSVL